jgi:uncharacterized protein (TIGR02246 family)
MTNDEAAIRVLLKEWLAAIRAGDFRVAADLLTDDAVLLGAQRAPIGKPDFITAAAQPNTSSIQDFAGDIRDLHVEQNVAYMWADLSFTSTPSRWASPVRMKGHSLAIFRKEHGRWLLARSADMSVRM